MREIENIVNAYRLASAAGKRTALATVVDVEGSSYRRPGARMLIDENGGITGAISGGCLEGDALRRALHGIERGTNSIAVYDTTEEDHLDFGIQLGCNGIVRILFEPIDPAAEFHAVQLLEKVLERRESCLLGTFFSRQLGSPAHPGTCFFQRGGEIVTRSAFPQEMPLADDTKSLTHSVFKDYSNDSEMLTAFIEYIPPPIHLVIAGAGNDAQPLARMADILGWRVTVIDGRATHATKARFPGNVTLRVAAPNDVFHEFASDAHTAFVLMTHNYRYDLAALRQAIGKECFYIGVLGPKEKLRRMQEDLAEAGIAPNSPVIHGPTGLDIGAETAEEIALSILAEIKAVNERKNGGSLRDKSEPIHPRMRHAG